MITQAQYHLISILKASLFGATFCYPEEINWDDVITEAKAQTVVGLMSTVIPVHDQEVDQSVANYMRIMYEQDCLVRLFEANNIQFVIIKGAAAAINYPKPYLRTMGDIDILVPQNYFVNAMELLESNGYEYLHGKNENDNHNDGVREIEYLKNGIDIELHKSFSSPGVDVDDILEEAISRREYRILNGFRFPILPEVENGLVLIGHINQHIKNNGLGLRQIVDWEMYLHSITNHDEWEEDFVALLGRVGLLTLAAYVTRMCNIYLGLPESFSFISGVNDDIAEELLEVILTDGNFGRREMTPHSSDEKCMRGAIYNIRRYGVLNYFTEVGIRAWRHNNEKSAIKPVAFFYGLFRQIRKGIIALLNNKNIGKHINEGKMRYELYKKLGVRNDDEFYDVNS